MNIPAVTVLREVLDEKQTTLSLASRDRFARNLQGGDCESRGVSRTQPHPSLVLQVVSVDANLTCVSRYINAVHVFVHDDGIIKTDGKTQSKA
jgi:hypothetical protein